MVRPTVDWYREDPQIAALKQLLSELPPEFRELAQRIKNAIDQIHPDIIGVILSAIHETLMKALEGKSEFSRKVSTILGPNTVGVVSSRNSGGAASNDDTYLKAA